MDQEPRQQRRVSPLTVVLIIIIVLLIAAAAVLALGKFGGEKEPEAENLGNGDTPLIGYEEGVTVVDDADALQNAVDEAYAEAAKKGVPLEYQNEAFSYDGTNFDCYIANPTVSDYDVYFQIFQDDQFTQQLYLSKLIPPGSAKRELVLDKRLEEGTNRVYVVFTQVEDDHATAYQQATVTMDFIVEEK